MSWVAVVMGNPLSSLTRVSSGDLPSGRSFSPPPSSPPPSPAADAADHVAPHTSASCLLGALSFEHLQQVHWLQIMDRLIFLYMKGVLDCFNISARWYLDPAYFKLKHCYSTFLFGILQNTLQSNTDGPQERNSETWVEAGHSQNLSIKFGRPLSFFYCF